METMNKEKGVEFLTIMQGLEPETRVHFGNIILKLAKCYKAEDRRAVIVIENDNSHDPNFFAGINCTEMDAARILNWICGVINDINTDGAPDKGMFN